MFQLTYYMPTIRGRYKTTLGTYTIWVEKDDLWFIFGKKQESVPIKDICAIRFNGVEYSNKNGDLFNGVD